MTEILFYHLTTRPLEAALPGLLEKTLERGWRAVVKGGSEERLEMLNRHLWTYRDESFLPHGAAADGNAPLQPIYLTTGDDAPNSPDVWFLVDGAAGDLAAMQGYSRVCILFNGHDAEATEAARTLWRSVTEAGLKAIYWQQTDTGGWSKKSENPGTDNSDGNAKSDADGDAGA